MGSSSSKATRKLPTKARRPTPSWAGARTPHPDPLYPAGTEPARSVPPPNQTSQRSTADPRGLGYATGSMRPNMGVSESKSDDIQRDAQDPDYLAKLSKLGQVTVPKAGMPYSQTAAPGMRTLLNRSAATSLPSSTPTEGLLSADQLSALFDRLKTAPADTDPSTIYKALGLTDASMSDLRRWVNSPSVDKDRTKVEVNEQGEETLKMLAVWVDREASPTPYGPTASR